MLNIKKYNKISKNFAICFLLLILAGAFLIFTNTVFAQTAQETRFGMDYAEKLGLANNDPRIVIVKLVRIALGFIGIIAIIFVLYAGFLWMTSAGNEQKIAQAKKTLVNAIIGLIIILSSFLIVSFIINKMSDALDNGGGGGGGRPQGPGGGIGAIGNCAIESVYPEPYQKDVPRNTSIIVTFREAVDPDSIMSGGQLINDGSFPSRVSIFKDGETTEISNVSVSATTDSRTFIFTPNNYLGSPSEDGIIYWVYLDNRILNSEGNGIFDRCGITKEFQWHFSVSNRLDLIPPQVLNGGVFPPPDNSQDTYTGTDAVAAQGNITIASQPLTGADAAASINPEGVSPSATVAANPNSQYSGTYRVAMASADQAVISRINPEASLGSVTISNRTINFPAYFSLTVNGTEPIDAGDSWQITLTASVPADTVTVGNIIYRFVYSDPLGNNIPIGATTNDTAQNLLSALSNNPSVTATLSGNRINVQARQAGSAGNNIVLNSSSSSRLPVSPMAGGTEANQTVDTHGSPLDQPRNAVIQINFNEAINPATVSGSADQIENYIRVFNITTNSRLNGNFVVSNQYRTIEFISDNLCGVNGCGERIYCLPENSHLQVELVSASLMDCATANCQARSPYNTCGGNNCVDGSGHNYPLSAAPLTGIADTCLNSLDGNRDTFADGPVSFYDENNPNASDGDSFQWSFFINDQIDLTPPVISAVLPANNANNSSLSEPVTVDFTKLMMSSSLRTGSVTINNGQENIVHKLINLRGLANQAVGYWVAKVDVDDNLDGNFDHTRAEIRHSNFADSTSFRAQVGSGVKDIYQNCYSPSAGPGCTLTGDDRSCCPNAAGGLDSTTLAPGDSCP